MHKTKLTIFLAVISIALFGMAGVAWAAPEVLGVTGDLNNGASVTVAGSGFGTKTTATPWRWDPIEGISAYNGLSNNSTIPASTGGYWDHSSEYHYNTEASTQRGVSTANIESNLSTTLHKKLATTLPDTSFDRETYISYWIYHSSSLSSSDNVKTIRFWKAAPDDQTSTFTVVVSWVGNGPWTAFKYDGAGVTTTSYCGTFSGVLTGGFVRPIGGEWERVEFYLKQESVPPTSDDGQYWISQTANGAVHTYSSASAVDETCATITSRLRWMTFGYENNVALSMQVIMDDIYIDSTRTRVEIGNASTWSANTHREIQIPSAWSDTSTTITLNQGSFDTLEGKYLYVIDADGNVNANGHLLTTTDITPPSAPSGLVIN